MKSTTSIIITIYLLLCCFIVIQSAMATPIFAVAGNVTHTKGEAIEPGTTVTVTNESKEKLTKTVPVGKIEQGLYSVTFFNSEQSVADVGDSLTLVITDPKGKVLTQQVHTITASDISTARAIINLTIEPIIIEVSETLSEVKVNPLELQVSDTGAVTIEITLRDLASNPIPDLPVQVQVSGSQNILSEIRPTNAQGMTTARLTSTKAEEKTITVIAGGTTLSGGQVRFNPGPFSANDSKLAVSPASVIANGEAQGEITITVSDAFGNPLKGKQVEISVTGSDNQLDRTEGTTGADSVAQFTLKSTTVESKTITATVEGTPLSTSATVDFVPGPVAILSVKAEPTFLFADGISQSQLTIATTDALNHPLEAQEIQLRVTPPELGLLGDVTDNGDGSYTANYTAPSEKGTALITASASGISGTTQILIVNLGEADFNLSTVEENLIGEQGGEASDTLIVVGISGFNQPVTLRVDNLPTGVSGAFEPKIVTPTITVQLVKSKLTLSIAPDAPLVDSHEFTVLATTEIGVFREIPLILTIDEGFIITRITLLIDPQTVEFGKTVRALGELILDATLPDTPQKLPITLTYESPTGEGFPQFIETDDRREFDRRFAPTALGKWTVTSRFEFNGYQTATETKPFNVIKGLSRIDWLSPPAATKLGSTVMLTGQLAPPLVGETITIQIQPPGAKTAEEVHITTGEGGIFEYAHLFNQPDEWRITAVWGGSDTYESTTSPLIIEVAKEVGVAIVVEGGGDENNNPHWDWFHSNAAFVYRTLRKRAFTDEDIYYLSPSQNPDLTVDATTSLPNLQRALLQWAASRINANVPLYLYLISHNLDDRFLLEKHGDREVILTSGMLDGWLDQLPTDVPTTVIIEACHSGTFIPLINAPNRVVITSTRAEVQAQIRKTSSFTRAFFRGIADNQTLKTAFENAENQLELIDIHAEQDPRIDADGDGIPNELADLAILADVYLPDDFISLAGVPTVFEVNVDPRTLSDGNATATISARLSGVRVAQIVAAIIPPDFLPAVRFTEWIAFDEVELVDPDGDGVYQGAYPNFTQEGEYRVVVTAEDAGGDVSVPVEIVVAVSKPFQLSSAPWDVNGDGVVNIFDLVLVGGNFGKRGTGDVNGDGIVNIFDLVTVGAHFGERVTPAAPPNQ